MKTYGICSLGGRGCWLGYGTRTSRAWWLELSCGSRPMCFTSDLVVPMSMLSKMSSLPNWNGTFKGGFRKSHLPSGNRAENCSTVLLKNQLYLIGTVAAVLIPKGNIKSEPRLPFLYCYCLALAIFEVVFFYVSWMILVCFPVQLLILICVLLFVSNME